MIHVLTGWPSVGKKGLSKIPLSATAETSWREQRENYKERSDNHL